MPLQTAFPKPEEAYNTSQSNLSMYQNNQGEYIPRTQERASEISMIQQSLHNESHGAHPAYGLGEIGEHDLESQQTILQALQNDPTLKFIQSIDVDPQEVEERNPEAANSKYIHDPNQVTIKRKPKNQRSFSYLNGEIYAGSAQPILIRESLELVDPLSGAQSPAYNVGVAGIGQRH